MVKNNASVNLLKKPSKSVSDKGNPYHVASLYNVHTCHTYYTCTTCHIQLYVGILSVMTLIADVVRDTLS